MKHSLTRIASIASGDGPTNNNPQDTSTPQTPLLTNNSNMTTNNNTTTSAASSGNLVIPTVILPNQQGISTPADSDLLGEIITPEAHDGLTNGASENGTSDFHVPPPSPRHDGIVLSEPTQWEQFADSIVKNHLDKTQRRGGAASANNNSNHEDGPSTSEQNIEL